MFTDHPVSFSLSTNHDDLANFISEILPELHSKLNSLGKPLKDLSTQQRENIFWGLGNMSGRFPMICLTEVPKGRSIEEHRKQFGNYGLVLSHSWVSSNKADRVIYVGLNSEVSKQLFICLATMKILGLFLNEDGNVLFEIKHLERALNLLCHIETRANLEQAEWRIAGNHGFMGGVRSTWQKIPLFLEDVEYVFAPSENEIIEVSEKIDQLAYKQNAIRKPIIITFPDVIPN